MACKERNKDQDILQTIAQRSAAKEHENAIALMDVTWVGNLLDVQFHVPDLDNVLHVTRLSKNNYVATIITKD